MAEQPIPLGYQTQESMFVCNKCAFEQYGVVGDTYKLINHQTLWDESGEDLYGIYSWDADDPHGITCDSCDDIIDDGWCERVNVGSGNGYCQDCFDAAMPSEMEDIDG